MVPYLKNKNFICMENWEWYKIIKNDDEDVFDWCEVIFEGVYYIFDFINFW